MLKCLAEKIILSFYRCMHYFGSTQKLELQPVDCGKMNDCAILLPSEGNNLLSFDNHGM